MKGIPLTTDEYLFLKSADKDFLNNQLLKAVKETAIDCNLYSKTRESEKLVCYGFGKVKSNDFSSFPRIAEIISFVISSAFSRLAEIDCLK